MRRRDLLKGVAGLGLAARAAPALAQSPRARVLRPGGLYADLDLPAYGEVDPLTAFMMDWDTDNNGEPFWRGYHELDMQRELADAGFTDVRVANVTSEALRKQGNYQGKWSYRVVMGTKP